MHITLPQLDTSSNFDPKTLATTGMEKYDHLREEEIKLRMDLEVTNSNYRWFMLALSGATATLAVAAPSMAMPVLFSEIADDLHLSLVQIGAVWGTVSFAGLFAGLAGGMLGDRFGTKRTLTVACLLLGLAGASRGLSSGLLAMTVTVFLSGLVSATIPMNLHKVCATWFSGKQLGKANAVISGGMALGFMIGSLISATILSPWLGGWRNVLFFYGGIAVLMSVPWAFTETATSEQERLARGRHGPSIRQTFSHVARLRDVWILGIALLGVGGGVQGLLGYLPLYLRGIEWSASRADATLASFHAISLIAVIPLAWLSDRLGSRKQLLVAATLIAAAGIGLLSIVEGAVIWVAVLMAGAVRDGYMAVFMTAATEVKGVGAAYAGTAIGLAMTLSRVGGLIAPPLGNGLARFGARTPFILWAAMTLLGLAVLSLARRRRTRAETVGSA
ncbi:MFS transporter [Candidatus Bipolaricaulota bacterium]|nr:MFS transporter [Candidatus Bipolaricaulota bacterium]